MAVVAAADSDGFILQQVLHPAGGLPVELDIGDLALLVDEGEGVHPEALHVAVVQGDADVILQEGELHSRTGSVRKDIMPIQGSQWHNALGNNLIHAFSGVLSGGCRCHLAGR